MVKYSLPFSRHRQDGTGPQAAPRRFPYILSLPPSHHIVSNSINDLGILDRIIPIYTNINRTMALGAIVRRETPSAWEALVESPWLTLAKLLYAQRSIVSRPGPANSTSSISVVCISDIHNTQPELPEGDVLLVAGDLTEHGTIEELSHQLDWLSEQPHRHKIVIAGNHDICLDPNKSALLNMPHLQWNDWRWDNITYLEDSSTTLQFPTGRSLKVYGSPWTRRNGPWAFQYEKDQGIMHFIGRIDHDVDILITHSPPKCHLDCMYGEDALLQELWRVRPKLHCFGHIHGGHGSDVVVYDRLQHLYELASKGKGELMGIILMALILLWQRLFLVKQSTSCTTLVNAAVVGGRSTRRSIQVVRI